MSFKPRTRTWGHLFALALAFTLTAGASHDDGGERERQVRIVACEGGEVARIDVGELALGETRDIGVSCGKVVSVTRTEEDEVRVAIDGEVVDLGGGSGDSRRKVVVRTHRDGVCADGEDCEEEVHVRKVVVRADGDEDVDVMALIGEELLGDCEDGDEDCRAEVLRLLEEHDGEGDGDRVVVIKKRIHTGDGDHDHDHDRK